MTLAWQLEWPCFFKTSLGDSDKMFAWKRLMLISNINTDLVKIKCSWTYFKQEVLPALLLAIKEKGNGDQKEWNKKVWRLSCNTTLSISQRERGREGNRERERSVTAVRIFSSKNAIFPLLNSFLIKVAVVLLLLLTSADATRTHLSISATHAAVPP